MKIPYIICETAKAPPDSVRRTKRPIVLFIPVLVAVLLLLAPGPHGMEHYGWRFFAIFVGVIVGLFFEPLPGGV
ncbi:anion permease, partial [Erwinia amylovora]|uniref:anion permease n=1 Tax=Erwinia amylovora TaxID=552 RepID=UPI0020BDD3E4